MRYRLRTLLILMTIGPPMLAGLWWAWPKVVESHRKPSFDELIDLIAATIRPDSWDDIGGPGSIDEFGTACFILVDAEGNPDGPDACGRNYSYTSYSEYSEAEDDLLPLLPLTTPLADDPFAIVK